MAKATSQNGYQALEADSALLYSWMIPAKNGAIALRLHRGPLGFVLAWIALRLGETIVALGGKVKDDWGYAYRPIRGYTTELSNHSSGTAMDLNAVAHPLGKVRTWTAKQTSQIHALLKLHVLRLVVRWGGDYHGRKDEMHFEIVGSYRTVVLVAKALAKTPRGRRLLAANETQRALIKAA